MRRGPALVLTCFRGRVLARHITSPCRGGATGGKVCMTSRCQCRRRLEVCDGRPHRLHVLWRARSCSIRALFTQPRCRSGTALHCFGRQGVSSVFRGSAHFCGFLEAHKTAMVRNVLTPKSNRSNHCIFKERPLPGVFPSVINCWILCLYGETSRKVSSSVVSPAKGTLEARFVEKIKCSNKKIQLQKASTGEIGRGNKIII